MNEKFSQGHQTFQKKLSNFHKQIARKQRQSIISKKRIELHKSLHEYPLISSSLQKYCHLSARQIALNLDQILQTLDGLYPQQLSQQDHQQLCQDLLYLLTTHPDFSLPYNFSFLKDASQYTATVVSYALYSLADEQIGYWMTYMNTDTKDLMYLKILSLQDNYERWIQNLDFVLEVIRDWGYHTDAQIILLRLLETVDDQEDFSLYYYAWKRIFEMKKQKKLNFTPNTLIIMGKLMIFLIQDPEDHKNKKFHFIKILFNEAFIQIYANDKNFNLENDFTRIISLLMDLSREFSIAIFAKEAFIAMTQIVLENFHSKFTNALSPRYLKQTMNESHANKAKTQFIDDLLSISLNYIRINRCYHQNDEIPENFLIMLNAEIEPQQHAKFNKLLNINSFKDSKNPNNTQFSYKQTDQNVQNPNNVDYQI